MEKIREKLPLILATAGSVLYVTLIFNNNVWMDEAFTALLVKGSFREMMSRSLADTLPPLYNIWAWCLTHIFGYNTLILKLSSVIPAAVLLFYSAVRVSALYDKNTAACFILTLIAMPHLLSCTVEIRMYAFCLSFVTMAVISALYLIRNPSDKDFVLLVVFTLFAGYSHHYGMISLLFVWSGLLIFFIKKREGLGKFVSCAVVTAVLFIPYLIMTIYQIKNASAYFSAPDKPTISSFISSLRYPFVTNITPLSAILLLALVFVFLFGSRKKEGLYLVPLYAAVLSLSYILEFITGRAFFSGRYLIPSFGALWLGFSILLFAGDMHLPGKIKKAVRISVIVIIILSGITDYVSAFRDEYAGDVRGMLAFFEENVRQDDGYIIFEDNYQIEWCLKYYEPELKKYDPEKTEKITGNIWCFVAPGYDEMLDEMPVKAYNKDYKGELSFDRYRFSVYMLEKLR